MKTISIELAKELINFTPHQETSDTGFGESQLEGTVAAFNMLARNNVAYIADEVGMGKTYVALGVLGIMRHLNPELRALVIAPRENIQLKWIKELSNFVRNNWRIEDLRFKGLNQRPVYESIPCDSLESLAREAQTNDHRDFFLKMTSFSISTKEGDRRRQYRDRLLPLVPACVSDLLVVGRDPDVFRDNMGKAINSVFPDVDLLIVDEAHNLKHGFSGNVSNRNRVLGFTLGHPDGKSSRCPWYGKRFKYLLLLSATPFEYDYADICRQLDVLGMHDVLLADADSSDRRPVQILADRDADEADKKHLVERILLRRVQYLKIAHKKFSKNMYRREWRGGGLNQYDDPMRIKDPKQRMIVGLIQKKVAEVLGETRFGNSFQIGMLSSFESFMETLSRKAVKPANPDEEGSTTFDDSEQAETADEKKGIDTDAIVDLSQSYRKEFCASLPHPKLDATAESLVTSFSTGKKALVFVRRIASVWELKEKLDGHFNIWLKDRILSVLSSVPILQSEMVKLFVRYEDERRSVGVEDLASPANVSESDSDEAVDESEDEGGKDTFFSWFFRGRSGPKGVLSGAAFQRNRLSSISATHAIFFEDNYVQWLLGCPQSVFDELVIVTGCKKESLQNDIQRRAYGYFRRRTGRKKGYPRLYVFQAYQAACLQIISDSSSPISVYAAAIFGFCFSDVRICPEDAPSGFPSIEEVCKWPTFFTELVKESTLREKIWPDEGLSQQLQERRMQAKMNDVESFKNLFRRREHRRLLISAIARLGLSFIDLYLLGIRNLNSLYTTNQSKETVDNQQDLPRQFVELLKGQCETGGLNAFYELSKVSAEFDLILAVNFHDIHRSKLSDVAKLFARTLQHQMPVGGIWGSVNKRLVKQFRMPGFPLVLVTTDVLQEGEDLHTFCRQVIHYGIAWTPSALEQRTGRIDRIQSLTQRTLDGRENVPDEMELLQVFYPHLIDTVEVLQVRRVLVRVNRFLKLIHRTRPDKLTDDSRIRIEDEILRLQKVSPVIKGLLEPAFPVTAKWLTGELGKTAIIPGNSKVFEQAIEYFWNFFTAKYCVVRTEINRNREYSGTIYLRDGHPVKAGKVESDVHLRNQRFTLGLKSQLIGNRVRLHCSSSIGFMDLDDEDTLNNFYNLLRDHDLHKICARKVASHQNEYLVTVAADILFDPRNRLDDYIEQVVIETIHYADLIEHELIGVDVEMDEEGNEK